MDLYRVLEIVDAISGLVDLLPKSLPLLELFLEDVFGLFHGHSLPIALSEHPKTADSIQQLLLG